MHLDNIFDHINSFHQTITFTIEGDSNRALTFLDTFFKQMKPAHTNKYLHYSSLHQLNSNKTVAFSLFNGSYQMKAKDLSKIAIVKGIKLQSTVGERITSLAGIRRWLSVGKIKEAIQPLKNTNQINKISPLLHF